MKILLFTLEYPPFHGGVANYYGNLVKYWPSFAKTTEGKPASTDEANSIFVLNNNDGRLINKKLPLLKWLPAYFALAAKIKQEKIGHILVGQILPLGAAALICAKFFKTKYSVILHGMDLAYALKLPRKKWLAEKILNQAEKIICGNSYTAEMARQNFPDAGQKIIVVNPGVENHANSSSRLAAQLRDKYNLQDKIILLSVGRLVKRKGFDKVIEAMPEILKQTPNLIYIIIGAGDEIINSSQEKNIKIISKATDEERDSWYNASDIFIMPSRNINGDFEGFGLVYLEANLAGKPVIAGKSGGVSDAVADGVNGLLVDPEDTKQIAAAVIELAKNPELRRKLGEQGKKRAINDFNWEKQIKKIYQAII
ncbi:MAG: glycosyltransferase family 4 protein [Patescibacteria group bacterium]|nr:glycosyltransferase family 4 protein [Patescibacteria group bacterium]